MYILDAKNFDLETYPTFISPKKAIIIKKEYIKNVYQEMKKQDDSVLIRYNKYKTFLLSLV